MVELVDTSGLSPDSCIAVWVRFPLSVFGGCGDNWQNCRMYFYAENKELPMSLLTGDIIDEVRKQSGVAEGVAFGDCLPRYKSAKSDEGIECSKYSVTTLSWDNVDKEGT